jgi:uncharacterized membrane protein YccC
VAEQLPYGLDEDGYPLADDVIDVYPPRLAEEWAGRALGWLLAFFALAGWVAVMWARTGAEAAVAEFKRRIR